MRYSEFHPPSPLNQFVECFWALESNAHISDQKPERILPDGCGEVILNFAEPFAQHDEHSTRVQPRNFIVGQMTRPISISPTGPVQLIGIRFHPGGATPFFRLPMNELTNQVVELGSFARTLEAKLLSEAVHLPELKDKVAGLQKVLLGILRDTKSDFGLLRIAARIIESSGMVPVDDLANEAGLSSRQLERRFLSEVGIGPKLLSRILRFQQVFRAVDANEPAWPTVAVDCGYYDQAHLIKDFRQFAHETPAVLFAEYNAFTESFTRKRRMSGFSNTR
ncbi:MAG TPA: helix-turn-helix domain-containing protein [Pyrinomonadaceae bacterium]|nr:helix-turn-helix domain-containing protein [Pyrinomonadaceae bacterium]